MKVLDVGGSRRDEESQGRVVTRVKYCSKSSETRKRPSYLENMKIFGKISENLFSEEIDLEARLGHTEE